MSQGPHFVIPALDSISGAFGQIFNDALDSNFLKWDSFVALYGSQSDVYLIRQQFLGGLPKVTYQHRFATDCSSKQGHAELTNFFNRLHGTYEVDNQGINVFTVGPKCFIKAVMAEVGMKSTCSRKNVIKNEGQNLDAQVAVWTFFAGYQIAYVCNSQSMAVPYHRPRSND